MTVDTGNSNLGLGIDVTTFVTTLLDNDPIFAGFSIREEPANTDNFTVMFLEMTGSTAPVL